MYCKMYFNDRKQTDSIDMKSVTNMPIILSFILLTSVINYSGLSVYPYHCNCSELEDLGCPIVNSLRYKLNGYDRM